MLSHLSSQCQRREAWMKPRQKRVAFQNDAALTTSWIATACQLQVSTEHPERFRIFLGQLSSNISELLLLFNPPKGSLKEEHGSHHNHHFDSMNSSYMLLILANLANIIYVSWRLNSSSGLAPHLGGKKQRDPLKTHKNVGTTRL